MLLGDQENPGDEDAETIYGRALMVSESFGVERKRHDGGEQIMVLVDSGASGVQLFVKLNYSHLDHVDLNTPRKIGTAGGSQMVGTMKGLLEGFFTDEHYLIAVLILSGIGSKVQSITAAVSKDVASIFDTEIHTLTLKTTRSLFHSEWGYKPLLFDIEQPLLTHSCLT